MTQKKTGTTAKPPSKSTRKKSVKGGQNTLSSGQKTSTSSNESSWASATLVNVHSMATPMSEPSMSETSINGPPMNGPSMSGPFMSGTQMNAPPISGPQNPAPSLNALIDDQQNRAACPSYPPSDSIGQNYAYMHSAPWPYQPNYNWGNMPPQGYPLYSYEPQVKNYSIF